MTCSAELLPAFGEYERFCAAILNAAISPVVGGYTRRLATALGSGRLRLLRSSLGIMPADEAAAFPTRAMFSGPAGGVLATARLANRAGFTRAAAFDMGGTSADVCLVHNGDASGEHRIGIRAGLDSASQEADAGGSSSPRAALSSRPPVAAARPTRRKPAEPPVPNRSRAPEDRVVARKDFP